MMEERQMGDMQNLFRMMTGAYTAHKATCERQVARWEWADGLAYDPRPYWWERNRLRRGRPLRKAPPALASGAFQYGFDQDNRVVVVREGTSAAGGMYETFFAREETVVNGARYDYSPQKDLVNVTREHYEGDVLRTYELHGVRGCSREEYEYEARRVRRVHVTTQEHGKQSESHDIDVEYDDLATVVKIVATHGSGYTRQLFKRAAKEYSARELEELIALRLREIVPSLIAKCEAAGPVYCVALVYDSEENDFLPPTLAVGLETERTSWMEKHGDDAPLYVWNPAEFTLFDDPRLSIDDEQLKRACQRFNAVCEQSGKWDAARKLLIHLANSFPKANLQSVVETTSDFVVVALDLHG